MGLRVASSEDSQGHSGLPPAATNCHFPSPLPFLFADYFERDSLSTSSN